MNVQKILYIFSCKTGDMSQITNVVHNVNVVVGHQGYLMGYVRCEGVHCGNGQVKY